MNGPSTLVIPKPAQGRTVAVVGDMYRFLAIGEETNGRGAKGPGGKRGLEAFLLRNGSRPLLASQLSPTGGRIRKGPDAVLHLLLVQLLAVIRQDGAVDQ